MKVSEVAKSLQSLWFLLWTPADEKPQDVEVDLENLPAENAEKPAQSKAKSKDEPDY